MDTEKIISEWKQRIDQILDLGDYTSENYVRLPLLLGEISSNYYKGFNSPPEILKSLSDDFNKQNMEYIKAIGIIGNTVAITKVFEDMKEYTIKYLESLISLLQHEGSGHS